MIGTTPWAVLTRPDLEIDYFLLATGCFSGG
jgi:hypothetical protein